MKLVIAVLFLAAMVQGQLLGGWKKVSEEKALELARKATDHLNRGLNSIHYVRHLKIRDAQQQIVSGINYKLEFTAAYTKCKKNTHTYSEYHNCEVLENSREVTCHAQIYEKPWENYTSIQVKCPGL